MSTVARSDDGNVSLPEERGIPLNILRHDSETKDGKAVRFADPNIGQAMENANMKHAVKENDASTDYSRGDDSLETRASIKRLEFKRTRANSYRRSLQYIDDTPDSQAEEDIDAFSPQTVGKLVSGSVRIPEAKLKEREESRDDDKEEVSQVTKY
ncbi:uncharacterized protein LOC134786401 [Penaeus indicus]|uniref:uncharacterized protein LOC134786401 n=1 Tax=Penaeus indicus TaxID=29960 RepID=UPI00300CED44